MPESSRPISAERFSKCPCNQCGKLIEFPIRKAGTTVCCPYCGESTHLKRPTSERLPLYLGIGAGIIAVGAAIGFGLNFRHTSFPAVTSTNNSPPITNSVAAQPKILPVASPDEGPWHGLNPGDVSLQKIEGSHLVYAIGVVHNETDKQRFGVKIELDLINASGEKIGTAKDYVQYIEPKKDWHFRALVTETSAMNAKVASITEN